MRVGLMWTWAVLLALPLVWGAQAVANEQAGEAVQPVAVTWPMPWEGRQPLVYDTALTVVSRNGGEKNTVQAAGQVRIETALDAQGRPIQHWLHDQTRVSTPGGGMMEELGLAFGQAAQVFDGVQISYVLDAQGQYVELLHTQAMAQHFRAGIDAMVVSLLEAEEGTSAMPMAQMRQEMDAMIGPTLDQVTQPDVVRQMLAQQPRMFNFVAGGNLVPGEERRFTDTDEVPMAAAPVARHNRVTLLAGDAQAGHYDVRWHATLDEQDARRAMLEATLAFMPQVPGVKQDEIMQFTRQMLDHQPLSFSSRVDYRIDAATGAVLQLTSITQGQYAGQTETETWVMTLREAP